MSDSKVRIPEGNKDKIVIICTEEQEKYIKNFGCIACDDDICDCNYCDRCAYDADNIEFKRA